jgi:hypothetical protein
MSHFAHASKYRHVYVDPPKIKGTCQGFRPSTATGEQQYIKGNTKCFALQVRRAHSTRRRPVRAAALLAPPRAGRGAARAAACSPSRARFAPFRRRTRAWSAGHTCRDSGSSAACLLPRASVDTPLDTSTCAPRDRTRLASTAVPPHGGDPVGHADHRAARDMGLRSRRREYCQLPLPRPTLPS